MRLVPPACYRGRVVIDPRRVRRVPPLSKEDALMMKRIVSLLAVLAMVALAAAPALAQAQGPGDPELHGPPHANSICSFSGLNDEPDLPAPEGGRTKNYGQLVRQGAA